MSETVTKQRSKELSIAKAELIEACIKLNWELKAMKEIIDGADDSHITALKEQSTKLQKCLNELHVHNANLIVNLKRPLL